MVSRDSNNGREVRGPDPFMQRFADLFIAICIPIAAASAGIVARFRFALSPTEAAGVGLLVLGVLVAVRLHGIAGRNRRATDRRIAATERLLGVLGGDLEAIERRLSTLESGMPRRVRDDLDQLIAEVEVIGTMTRQVIESVADLEISVAEGRAQRGAVARTRGRPARSEQVAVDEPAAGEAGGLVPERFGHLDDDAFLDLVRSAIAADRIELLLQPIVTLPQRKPRYYEALTRLRSDDGEIIHPSDYIPLAESRGFIAGLDEQILLKSVHVLRRLAARSGEVGVFLNLSAVSLGHADFFRDFVRVLEKNHDLCRLLVFEFPQAAVRGMGAIEHESLAALAELGVRFSVDRVADLKISFQNLADRGFRFVKIDADRLLHRPEELATDIHPADLADYFQRFGMELIADRVEREVDVVDVLDFGIRLGQGFLFSPPRPVRLDVLPARRPEPAATRSTADARTATTNRGRPAPAAGGRGDGRGEETATAAARPGLGRSSNRQPTNGGGESAPLPPRRGDRPGSMAPASEGDAPAVRPGIRIVPGTGAD
jgi:cyclic-di-GMP phosphodiesterase TipF (flagellum assembly factor)